VTQNQAVELPIKSFHCLSEVFLNLIRLFQVKRNFKNFVAVLHLRVFYGFGEFAGVLEQNNDFIT